MDNTELEANGANTKDWLEATKDTEIKAYVAVEDYALSTGICRDWEVAVADIMHRRADAWQKLSDA